MVFGNDAQISDVRERYLQGVTGSHMSQIPPLSVKDIAWSTHLITFGKIQLSG